MSSPDILLQRYRKFVSDMTRFYVPDRKVPQLLQAIENGSVEMDSVFSMLCGFPDKNDENTDQIQASPNDPYFGTVTRKMCNNATIFP